MDNLNQFGNISDEKILILLAILFVVVVAVWLRVEGYQKTSRTARKVEAEKQAVTIQQRKEEAKQAKAQRKEQKALEKMKNRF